LDEIDRARQGGLAQVDGPVQIEDESINLVTE
jgi:hypothetical protein